MNLYGCVSLFDFDNAKGWEILSGPLRSFASEENSFQVKLEFLSKCVLFCFYSFYLTLNFKLFSTLIFS